MAKKFWSFPAKDVVYRSCFVKPGILKNREIACISKTADRRDLRPCLNDSAGPILGGSSERHFAPTSTIFAVIAINEFNEKGGKLSSSSLLPTAFPFSC